MGCTPKALALAGTLALAAGQCLAQTTITLSTDGIIASGYDGLGLFARPDASLAGAAYTMSLTIDTTRMAQTRSPGENDLANAAGVPALVSGELTVLGRTYSWTMAGAFALASLSSNRNGASMSASGTNLFDGNVLAVGETIAPDASAPRFVSGTDFAQEIEFAGDTGGGVSFSTTLPYVPCDECPGASGPVVLSTYFSAASPHALWTASPVPEPAGWMMLAAGAGMLGWARRHTDARRSAS